MRMGLEGVNREIVAWRGINYFVLEINYLASLTDDDARGAKGGNDVGREGERGWLVSSSLEPVSIAVAIAAPPASFKPIEVAIAS